MVENPDLSPAQYTAHLQCATVPEARLVALIVPNIRTSLDGLEPFGFRITRLDPGSASAEINGALFGPAEGWPGGGMIPPAPTVPAYLADHREKAVKKLVPAIPCFRVDIHEAAFKTANLASALKSLAGSSTGPTDPANEHAMS